MITPQYVDLLITNRDFTLNPGYEPEVCGDRQSIGQDIIHAIYESGLMTDLIAERSPTLRADIFTKLEMLIEDDDRIVPGTVDLQEESPQRLWITASTYEFGPVSARVTL